MKLAIDSLEVELSVDINIDMIKMLTLLSKWSAAAATKKTFKERAVSC